MHTAEGVTDGGMGAEPPFLRRFARRRIHRFAFPEFPHGDPWGPVRGEGTEDPPRLRGGPVPNPDNPTISLGDAMTTVQRNHEATSSLPSDVEPFNQLYHLELQVQEMSFFLAKLDNLMMFVPEEMKLHSHLTKLHSDVAKLQGHLENLVMEDNQPKTYITKEGRIL